MHRRLGLASLLLFALGACDGGSGGDETAADASDLGTPDGSNGGNIDAAPAADAKPFNFPDAQPAALACAGDPLPTTVAAPPIVISGPIQEGSTSGIGTLNDPVKVEARKVSDDSVLVSNTFTAAYTLTDPDSSTTPLDAYIRAERTGYVDTYVYPPSAISENLGNAPIIMVSTTIFSILPILTGITQASGNGVLIVATVDCADQPIEGATISVSGDVGTVKYAGASGIPGTTDYSSTQSSGIAYIFNVPPGEYTVSASVGSVDLRDNLVKSFADANSTLVVAP